ncbi:MAG: SpoIID/LytB domain-containing protein [Candidatus Omnitrophota bacterium]
MGSIRNFLAMAAPLVFRLRCIVFITVILLSTIDYPCLSGRQGLSTTFADTPQQIRVLILKEAASFNFRVKGPYKITDAARKERLAAGNNLNTTVTACNDGIIIGAKSFKFARLHFLSGGSAEAIINGRRFRGDLEFIKNKNNSLSIVNHIDIEDYIKGILYHEVSHYWPIEVLKAQTIVCRSYAMYQKESNKARDYDLTSDIYSQVYGGKTSERYRSSIAVRDTGGAILTYKGKVLPAFFHATCAGHTQDASLVWDIDLPALKGVKCDFCVKSPHYKWNYVLPVKEFGGKLNESGYVVKEIKHIADAGRDNSGRLTDVEIAASGGLLKIPANKLRSILGPNLIRSTNFRADIVGSDVVFEGLGWGHGVGMCQWGAYFMAKEGRDYKDILVYYYPGTELRNID